MNIERFEFEWHFRAVSNWLPSMPARRIHAIVDMERLSLDIVEESLRRLDVKQSSSAFSREALTALCRVIACFWLSVFAATALGDDKAVRKVPGSFDVVVGVGDSRKSRVDLGDVSPGEVVGFVLNLRNESELPFSFDKLKSGCSCLKTSPDAGVIGPRESLEVSIEIKVVSRFTDKVFSSLFSFGLDGALIQDKHYVIVDFHPSKWIGFTSDMLELPVQGQENSIVKFEVPIIMGDKLAKEDLTFFLTGFEEGDAVSLDCEIKDRRLLIARLDLSKTQFLKGNQDRLFGELVVGCDSPRQMAIIAIVVSKTDVVRILPSVARLESDASLTKKATLMIKRAENSDSPLRCSGRVFVDGIEVDSDFRFLNSSVNQLSIQISPLAWQRCLANAKLQSAENPKRKSEITLKLLVEGKSVERKIPYVLQRPKP